MNIERWGWYSILVNLLLAVLHGLVALRSGSLAVTAELVHNIVDLMSAIAVLVGLRIASRRSPEFPYGLYKVENLIAAGLAFSVFLTAWEILRQAVFAPPAAVRADTWMLAALLATAVLPLVFSHFELRAGRAANSPALIADAREYRAHVFTTGLAFTALATGKLELPLDRLAAALISVAVLWTGWGMLRDAMRVLLDASLDPDTLAAIRRIVASDPAVVELKWITGRNAGRFRFVEAGVALRGGGGARSPALTARIEHAVRSAVPHVERVLLHVEAPATPLLHIAIPLADAGDSVSAHFGEAPWFAIVAVNRDDGAVAERRILPNGFKDLPQAKGIRVAEWLATQRVDIVLTREDVSAKGPAYVLRDAGIQLVLADATDPDTAITTCRRAWRGG